jgi:heme exporter protein D
MSSFWTMGGYAAFIWPAYAVSAIGLLVATVWTLKSWRSAKANLAAIENSQSTKT